MRVIISSLLFVGVAFAQISERKGTCPRGSGGIGICVFNPEINCTGDEGCEAKGQLCCPDGCNRSCKDPIYPPEEKESNQDVCPPTGVRPIGICTFDPSVNCLKNADCSMGQVCCPSGCNSVCKDALPRPVTSGGPRPVTPEGPRPVTPEYEGPRPVTPEGPRPVTPGPSEGPRPVTPEGPRPVTPEGPRPVTPPPYEGPRPVTPEGPRPVTPPPRASGVSCPPSRGSIGICSIDPKLSCSGDEECSNGKICCSKGCGRECVNPDPIQVNPASKP